MEEGSLKHWWALHARDQEEGCGRFPLPPLLLKLDRLIEVAARNQSQDCGLLPPTLTCSRGCEGPYDLGEVPGSKQETRSSCHGELGRRQDRKPPGGLPGFRTAAACPSMDGFSELRAQSGGEGSWRSKKREVLGAEVVEEVHPVREEPGGGCLLLLHGTLLSCALGAGALALVLGLPVPRRLLEHEPTVPGPQEEVDKAEELQRHRGNL
ncbi:hypothetical protein MDA_GLEAN10024720 [Myotis davidii]|uniref:Uncharacterized protein n=1 Tax=Myotis davidii TaxID=225400 RepID=L5LXK4_MYODS|nr:hypothetical protein MDA_GLEAN10024720 [Myotis davidii]